MIDPFQMGLMSMLAGQNPELASTALAGAGVPVPHEGFGDDPFGVGPGTATLGQLFAPQGPAAPVAPNPMMTSTGKSPFENLAGVKAPPAPKPLMNAGVRGAQQNPAPQNVTQGPSSMQMILSMLGGGNTPDPLRVPALGSMLR